MNFNKKSLTISFVITIWLILLVFANSIFNPVLSSLIILLIYFFMLYWLLDFDIQPMAFLNVLLLSSFYVQAVSLFIIVISRSLNNNAFILYGLIVVFFFAIEVINRTANIINISYIRRIPLYQVSQSFNYIFSIASLFISLVSVQLLGLPALSFLIYALVIVSIVLISNLSFIDIRDRKSFVIYVILSFIISFLFTITLVFLNIWSVYRSVILTLVVYLVLNYFYSYLRKPKRDIINILQVIAACVLIVMIVLLNVAAI